MTGLTSREPRLLEIAISGGFLLAGLVKVAHLACACRETASGRGLLTRQPRQHGPEPQTRQQPAYAVPLLRRAALLDGTAVSVSHSCAVIVVGGLVGTLLCRHAARRIGVGCSELTPRPAQPAAGPLKLGDVVPLRQGGKPGSHDYIDQNDHPLVVDMQVIVRLQDRGALRLDHLHDQALCGPKGEGDLRSPT